MPRRSTRTQPTEVPEGERRVTRRSVTKPEAEKPAPKAAAKGKASQPAPSRGRGRGRGAGRGRKAKRDEEEEPEETEEVAAEDAPEETEAKDEQEPETGDVPEKKPARGRGKGRKSAAAATPVKAAEEEKEEEAVTEPKNEDTEVADEENAEATEETVTPKRGRGRRSAGASPAKAETPPSSGRSSRNRTPRKLAEETPTRRSGRGRRSGGAEEETTPKKEEQDEATPKEDEPAAATETTGQKRKREDSEAGEVAEKKQKVEESTVTDAPSTEESMEVDESKAEPTDKDAPTATEPKAESEEKAEPASYPTADEPEKIPQAQSEASEEMDTTPLKTAEEKEPDMSEYVLVNKEEVPAADSAEVTDALPKEAEPVKEVPEKSQKDEPLEPSAPPAPEAQEATTPQPEPTSQPVSVIQEPVSANQGAPTSEPPTENGEENGERSTNPSMDIDNKPVAESPKDMAVPSNNVNSVAQEPGATIPDPLFQRQYVANTNVDSTLAADATRKFSVVSYNILADCHTQLSKYSWIAPDHLSQEYRHKKLLQELQYLDADIFCLQEVGRQYYENTLKSTMKALGYEGSYIKRIDDNMDEGEATFVRTSRFTVISQKGFALRDLAFKELGNSALENGNLDAVKRFVDRPSVVMISQLKCNNTGSTVTVGNIHVSWENLSKPDLQCVEVSDALKELVATATPQGAFLICGDFNSWPGSPVYQLTKEGYLSDQSVSELQGVNNVRMADGSLMPLINLWWKGFQHTATNMKSAYNQVLSNEPHTTRYPHNGSVKQVDFVWYSGNTLDAAGVLKTVNQEQLAGGIPNAFFPSDHVSLKANLVLKP